MDEYSNLEDDGPYGYGPDVLYQANDILMKYVKGKHILPIEIDKLESREQIPQNAWDAYKATSKGVRFTAVFPSTFNSRYCTTARICCLPTGRRNGTKITTAYPI